MNRVIKFRALVYADGEQQMLTFNLSEMDNGLWAFPENPEVCHIDEYISPLMQYTGKTNNSAIEFCEGDIVKTDSGAHMQIYYKNDMCRFVAGFTKGVSIDIEKNWEIIGNIYENPDLLTPPHLNQ